ncbi:Naphthalene 1,2-dioxygenase system, large oxygenase component, partial [Clarias magur]
MDALPGEQLAAFKHSSECGRGSEPSQVSSRERIESHTHALNPAAQCSAHGLSSGPAGPLETKSQPSVLRGGTLERKCVGRAESVASQEKTSICLLHCEERR